MATSASIPAQTTWVWDTNHQLYYSPESGTYAYVDHSTGEWQYMAASSLASTSTLTQPASTASGLKEEGEIDDDVGWGGLMEPEELNKALKTKSVGLQKEKHPAYSNPSGSGSLYDSLFQRAKSPSPPKETPKHLLRLVVLSSPSLTEGHVAIVDAREGGIQLGRDRCEKGGHARVRVKEMEVSKNHAVVYWGLGGQEAEGWWVVDLGSTHGTFVTPAVDDSEGGSRNGTSARSGVDPHRLSKPKTSSLPYPLAHDTTLTLGQTIFQVHDHPSWPCESCQLGRNNEIPIDTGEPTQTQVVSDDVQAVGNTVSYAMNSSERRGNRETNRKREMAALKDTLLNRTRPRNAEADEDHGESRTYLDRSAIRRKLHPKSPPSRTESTRAATSVAEQPKRPAPVSTFAQNMMVAQGYVPGTGLGKDKGGRSEAIEVKMRVEKRGLGAQGAEAPNKDDGNDTDWRKKGRSRRFDEVKGW